MGNKAGMLRTTIDTLASGATTAEEVLESCIARFRERDGELRAWVAVAPQPALGDGPLRGVPFGAKDIYETRGLATEFGSPVFAGRRGETDAALVVELRKRGAVLLGKTHTTAFAYYDPAPTRNPRDPRHTPGGSSSGSAAAVAAGMVPFALGTQTQGSVIRPASYCGVTGFKPTFGALPLEGVLPFAPSLDTAGLFTQTAGDMRLLWERMGFPVGGIAPRRLGVPREPFEVEDAMRHACEASVERLRAAGFEIETLELPPDFRKLVGAVRLVCDYEGARLNRQWREQFGERIGTKMAELVDRGLRIAEQEYRAAVDLMSRLKREMEPVFADCPVILTPAAVGPAPLGLSSTGDPRMNAPWTGLGVPAVTVPMPAGSGLPLGLQLTAGAGADAMLLNTAAAVEEQFEQG